MNKTNIDTLTDLIKAGKDATQGKIQVIASVGVRKPTSINFNITMKDNDYYTMCANSRTAIKQAIAELKELRIDNKILFECEQQALQQKLETNKQNQALEQENKRLRDALSEIKQNIKSKGTPYDIDILNIIEITTTNMVLSRSNLSNKGVSE